MNPINPGTQISQEIITNKIQEIKGINRPPKVILNHFYKLNGTEEECYFSFSRIGKEIYARWQPISNLESFTISLPN